MRVALVAIAAVASLAACGGGGSDADDTTPATAVEPTGPALVARADHDLEVHDEEDGEVVLTLPAATEFGSPRALLVLRDDGDWLEVALPERPNGSTGWVRRSEVALREVTPSVAVDLASRTLTLTDGGETVLTTTVAIGTDDAPTPTGRFYVVDKLATDEPGGDYGPFAFGLSAHSEVLTEFNGGDGQVGIHGTNRPDLLGEAVSHGCIRVPNEVAETMNQIVELGTPVTIA